MRDDVRLESLSLNAAERMLEWMRDPAVAENIALSREPSLEATVAWISRTKSDESVYARAIVWRGEHVGNVVLDHIDTNVRSARLSVYLGTSAVRGCGVGFTAVKLILQVAFGEMNLHKIWLNVRLTNVAAIRTYDRLGFRVEGVLRDEFVCQGRREGALRMGLLRGELVSAA